MSETMWRDQRHCFRIAVDNATLAAVISGHDVLKDHSLRPICVRICRNIKRLTQNGWRTHTWNADPVAWVPSELNKHADGICNYVMDAKAPYWYINQKPRLAIYSKYNIKIGTDGGSRGGRESSTGWGIFAVQIGEGGREGKHVPLLKGGTYFDAGQSSLRFEAIALDEVLAAMVNYL